MENHEPVFLDTIRKALGGHTTRSFEGLKTEEDPPDEARSLMNRIARRRAKMRGELLDRLTEEARVIQISVHPIKGLKAAAETIRDIALRNRDRFAPGSGIVSWRHSLLDRLHLEKTFAGVDIPFQIADMADPSLKGLPEQEQRDRTRDRLAAAFMGVTSADFCVARSATLVMRTRPGQPRAVSLAPEIHVAVIELKQLVADFQELYTLLKWHSNVRREGLGPHFYFVTGPSKTADIELQLVYGVHGPREVHLLVLTSGTASPNGREHSKKASKGQRKSGRKASRGNGKKKGKSK